MLAEKRHIDDLSDFIRKLAIVPIKEDFQNSLVS